MNPSVSPNLDRAIEELPSRFPGPGGAVAVVKEKKEKKGTLPFNGF